jgi:protein TonB
MSSTAVSTSAIRPGSFSSAMLEPPAGHKQKRMLQSVISIVVHTGVIAALLIVPLLVSSGLTLQKLDRIVLIAPPPPAAPAPPRPMVVHTAATATPQFSTPARLAVPTVVPKTIEMSAPELASAPAMDSGSGVLGGLGGVLGGDGTGAAPPPPVAVASGPKKPVFISGDMKRPVLIYSPTPVYPAVAKVAHISGTVVVMAIIDEHGNVVQAQAVSGPGILFQSALKTVTDQKYQPTILDGQPTPIQLRVEVQFQLSS